MYLPVSAQPFPVLAQGSAMARTYYRRTLYRAPVTLNNKVLCYCLVFFCVSGPFMTLSMSVSLCQSLQSSLQSNIIIHLRI